MLILNKLINNGKFMPLTKNFSLEEFLGVATTTHHQMKVMTAEKETLMHPMLEEAMRIPRILSSDPTGVTVLRSSASPISIVVTKVSKSVFNVASHFALIGFE
jgi:hypothetical protein